jgi:hypothetical protein
LNTAGPKLLAEICTVTLLAGPPVGQTSITNWAAWPGCTVPGTARTLMQSCVTVEDPGAVGDAVAPGEMLGVGPGGGELGDVGSIWHTPLDPAVCTELTLASAAAAVPTQSTATPANAANAVDPVRPLRRGRSGWEPRCGVTSRFSIIE